MTENTHSAGSDREPTGWPGAQWASHLADLENFRLVFMWRFAPEDPDQYFKDDRTYHLLAEVLLAQEQRRRSPDHMYRAQPPSDATSASP